MKEFLGTFFKDIEKRELVRKENLLYTLGDDGIDKFLYLDQNLATLAPDSGAIKNFASATYLFGLFGMVASNFTAVPSGFLVTYKSGSDLSTILIMDEDNPYFKTILLEKVNNKLQSDMEEKEKEVFVLMKTLLESDISLTEVVIKVDSLIKNNKQEKLLTAVDDAIYPFSSAEDKETGKALTLNSQNCQNNHIILRSICFKLLKINPETTNEKDLKLVKDLYKDILNEWILPGYLTYRGTDRDGNAIERDHQILNKPERIKQASQRFATHRQVNLIMNMCSTDYAADIVYFILSKIRNFAADITLEEAEATIDKEMPQTTNNTQQKKDARLQLAEQLGYVTEEEDLIL